MSDAEMTLTNPESVLVAVRIGRNGWVKKQAVLHYEASRLIRAEGIELAQTGLTGLTGTIYVVKDILCREQRSVMRVERQKIVNGTIVDRQNWGEIEEDVPQAA